MTAEIATTSGQVGRGLAWSTASNLILRAGGLVVSVIMARLIAPEQFGVFAVALTVWVVLGSLAEFGLGADLMRSENVQRNIPTVATLGLITSGSLALTMFLAAAPIAAGFDSPESAGVIRLMSGSLILTGFSIVPAALLQRQFRQFSLFAINSIALVVSVSVMTTLALAGFGPVALAWGQLSSQLVATVLQYIASKTRPRFGFDRDIARESAAFCLPLAFANLLSWALLSVDNFVIARTTNPTDLGLYVLAFNVSSWPMSAIGQAVRVVALPAFARIRSITQRNAALIATSGPLWAVSILLGLLLMSLAGPIVDFLYGAQWSGAVPALVALGAFGALRIVLDFLATFLISAGSTRAVLFVQVWWFITLIPAMVVGVKMGGLAGAGWAHVLVGAVLVLPAYMWRLSKVGVDWTRFLRAWLVPSIAIIPCAGAMWLVTSHVHPSAFVTLVVGGVVGPLVYALTLWRWFPARMRLLKSADISSTI